MSKIEMKVEQMRTGMAEMEAAIERLRSEIQGLQEQHEALEKGNLELYRKLISVDF